MLASALNFAIGFFGYPFEGQYQQLITIEANGVSCFFFFSLPCLFVRCGFVHNPRAVHVSSAPLLICPCSPVSHSLHIL
jgi:hypothetical protein